MDIWKKFEENNITHSAAHHLVTILELREKRGSEEGEAVARAVLMRKNILYDFLANILNVRPEQAEIDSCKTEHLISAETAKKLQEFIVGYRAKIS